MSRILITGATGLVGTAVLRRMTAAGHSVIALSRRVGPEHSGVRWVQADFREDIRPVLREFSAVDAVIHNAASLVLGRNEAELDELHKVNRRASTALIDWSVQQGVRKFLFTSTLSHVVRPLPNVITEDVPVSPSVAYSLTKYETEQDLQQCAQDNNLKAFIFRISSPVNPDPDFLPRNVIRLWIEKATAGENLTVFGTGSRTQDFVCVEDIAAAYELALGSTSGGLYNIASGTSLSMRELAEVIAGRCGVNVYSQGEDVNELERWNVSIEKARKQLGYAPVWTSRSVIAELLKCMSP